MPGPTTSAEFLELVRKSGVVDEKRLDSYLEKLRATTALPPEPLKMAGLLFRDGLVTRFQAEQFLQGKWRRFTIGKYKVLERIGSGGMGSVYLCEHKYMRRRAAVKVLPTVKAADPAALERFYREARAVAALDHPNLVRAYDVDHEENLHFLVMEYVDGTSLQDLVKKSGPFTPLRAVHYMSQAALGLQHAHEVAELVHRDIKPSNILVDRSGTVKVLDMGLARFFNDDEDILTKKYDENVLGTADYLAPEQVLDSHGVDIRADIYSLGATIYFCLTGRTPFGEGSVAQKLIWHQTRVPKPIRSFRSDVPHEVLAILDKMMTKNPAERYQSPAELLEVLAPLVQTPIPPPSAAEMPRLSPAVTGGNSGEVAALAPSRPRSPASTKPPSSHTRRKQDGAPPQPSQSASAPESPPTASEAVSRVPASDAPPETIASNVWQDIGAAAVTAPAAMPERPAPVAAVPNDTRRAGPEVAPMSTPPASTVSDKPVSNFWQAMGGAEGAVIGTELATGDSPASTEPSAATDSGRKQPVETMPEIAPSELVASPVDGAFLTPPASSDDTEDENLPWQQLSASSVSDDSRTDKDSSPAKSVSGHDQRPSLALLLRHRRSAVLVGCVAAFVVIALLVWAFTGGPSPNTGTDTPPARPPIRVSRTSANSGLRHLPTVLKQARPDDRIIIQDDQLDDYLNLTNIRSVTLEAEAGHSPIWHLPAHRGSGDEMIMARDTVGVTLRGFTFDGGGQVDQIALITGHCPGLTFDHLKFRGFKKYGVRVANGAGESEWPVTLRDVMITATDPREAALAFSLTPHIVSPKTNDSIVVRDCVFEGHYQSPVMLLTPGATEGVTFTDNLLKPAADQPTVPLQLPK
jgi:serine/threonine protein kinase